MMLKTLLNFTKKKPYSLKNVVVNVNKYLPIFKLENYEDLKMEDFSILSLKGNGLYMCQRLEHILTPDIIHKESWIKKDYIKDVKYLIREEQSAFLKLGYKCDEIWEINDKKYVICVLKTNIFIDDDIVTDIKLMTFPKKNNKCRRLDVFKVHLFNHLYLCDCKYKLSGLGEGNQEDDLYLCLSRKNNNDNPINMAVGGKAEKKKRKKVKLLKKLKLKKRKFKFNKK